MIFWSGFGFVVPVIALVTLAAIQQLVDGQLGEDYYTNTGWPKLLGCVSAAVLVLIAGLWMNKPTGQILVDKETGVETHVRPNHSFFFIPVQYWSAILVAFGIFMAFK